MKEMFGLLKETFTEWNEDHAPRLAAAMAYYTLFSIAPVLVIAIAVAGLVFGREAVEGQLYGQVREFVGDTGAAAVQSLVASASKPSSGIVATILGIGTLLFGAAGVFGQLQEALNAIWGVQPKPDQGIMGVIRQRFLSFSMVLGTGFLLLVSLIISTVLTVISEYFRGALPGFDLVWVIVTFLVGFLITLLLFALIFKVVPDAHIQWRDVWIGALITTVLFSIGRFVLAQYLGRGTFGSSYGAGAALIIVLLWVNYSAQILFLGAEFTQVYARYRGAEIRPASYAEMIGASSATEQTSAGTKPRIKAVHATAAREQGSAKQAAPAPKRQSPKPAKADEPHLGSLLAMIAGFAIGVMTGRRSQRL